MRNLIVDDDFGMAKTLTDNLFLKGFETQQVSCGLEALGQIKDGEFDWIILDILMPDINGIDVFRITKQEQPGTKVILMTAYACDGLCNNFL